MIKYFDCIIRTGDKVISSDSDEYSDDSLTDSTELTTRHLDDKQLEEEEEEEEAMAAQLAELEKQERLTARLAELANQWDDEGRGGTRVCTTSGHRVADSRPPWPRHMEANSRLEEERLIDELRSLQAELANLTWELEQDSLSLATAAVEGDGGADASHAEVLSRSLKQEPGQRTPPPVITSLLTPVPEIDEPLSSLLPGGPPSSTCPFRFDDPSYCPIPASSRPKKAVVRAAKSMWIPAVTPSQSTSEALKPPQYPKPPSLDYPSILRWEFENKNIRENLSKNQLIKKVL